MWRNLISCAVALTLAACGSSTEPKNGAAGTYAMIAYNGKPMPATDELGDIIRSGAITLGANGFFTQVVTIEDPNPSVGTSTSTVSAGQWSVSGSALTLTDTTAFDPGVTTVTLTGGVITYPNGTKYQRQ